MFMFSLVMRSRASGVSRWLACAVSPLRTASKNSKTTTAIGSVGIVPEVPGAGLAALGVTVAALTAGLRGGAALGGLLVIPMAVPVLIFGAGSLGTGGESGLALTAAASLVLMALAPFAGGAAVRAARG